MKLYKIKVLKISKFSGFCADANGFQKCLPSIIVKLGFILNYI